MVSPHDLRSGTPHRLRSKNPSGSARGDRTTPVAPGGQVHDRHRRRAQFLQRSIGSNHGYPEGISYELRAIGGGGGELNRPFLLVVRIGDQHARFFGRSYGKVLMVVPTQPLTECKTESSTA